MAYTNLPNSRSVAPDRVYMNAFVQPLEQCKTEGQSSTKLGFICHNLNSPADSILRGFSIVAIPPRITTARKPYYGDVEAKELTQSPSGEAVKLLQTVARFAIQSLTNFPREYAAIASAMKDIERIEIRGEFIYETDSAEQFMANLEAGFVVQRCGGRREIFEVNCMPIAKIDADGVRRPVADTKSEDFDFDKGQIALFNAYILAIAMLSDAEKDMLIAAGLTWSKMDKLMRA